MTARTALALVVCCAVMAGAPVGRGHDVATQPLAIDAWPMERPIRTLFDAVLTGDPDAARRLLQQGADPNQRNPEGATPVMFVSPGAQAGYVAVADALIAAGADVNAVNNKGETAASLALRYGRMDALVCLIGHGAKVEPQVARDAALLLAAAVGDAGALNHALAAGADPNARALTPTGSLGIDPPVVVASARGRRETLRILLDAGAEPNVMGRTSGTPLFAAIRQADAEMVRLLLAHGADANGRGAMSWTPLMEAARGDRLEIARLLVAAGAELGATDAHGETAAQVAAMSGASRTARFLMQMGGNTKEILGLLLVTAAEKGDDADVGRLLAEGADLNAQRTYSGGAVDSALSAALAGSHDSTARVLLAAGADPNLGGTVRTPLAAAAGTGRPELVRLLLEKGVDARSKNLVGRTALMYAAAQGENDAGRAEIVQMLIAAGSDVNARDNQGMTALELAVAARNAETAGVLRAAGAKASPSSDRLPTAVEAGNMSEIDTLLALGADLEHEGKQGMTPLMTAAERGRADIVGRLLAAGADPRRTDPGGWSALTHAVYRDRLDVVELLLSAGAEPNERIVEGSLLLLVARKILTVQLTMQIAGDRKAVQEAATRRVLAAEGAVAESLLAHGADPNAGDEDGLTPLMYAAARGQLDLVLALVRHGADVNATTADGITAWQVATGDDVIRALQEARSRATTGRRFAILAADPAAAPRRQSRSERN